MKRIPILLFFLVACAILITACQSKKLEPVNFTIHMKEYSFDPMNLEAKVGQEVTIELINDGTLAHEFLIGKDVNMVDSRPSDFTTDMFKAAGVEPTITGSAEEPPVEGETPYNGYEVHLEKTGDKATISFPVTKEMVGEWEIGCFEQEGVHYTAGMKGTFTVTP